MLGIAKQLVEIAQPQPTPERLQARKKIIPLSSIKSILQQTARTTQTTRLPKWFMVFFVSGMGLFASDCYRQIFRWLQRFRRQTVPGRSPLCDEARKRLGVAPLMALIKPVVQLQATPALPGLTTRTSD